MSRTPAFGVIEVVSFVLDSGVGNAKSDGHNGFCAIVSAIEGGSRAITMERGIRAAHRVGPITVEVDGMIAAIVPVRRVPTAQTVMGPGDAGWVVREELQEATEALPRLEAAFLQRNRLGLVKAAEQVVSDVTHALSLLAGALDAFDVTIRRDADTRHRGKLARKLGADRDVCLFEVKQGG